MTDDRSAKWIQLDPSRYEAVKWTAEALNDIRFFVSPYDLPDAVRADYTPEGHRVTLDFRYIGVEPTETRKVDDHVWLSLGKTSHRVYKIEADVDRLARHGVAMRIVDAIDHLWAELGPKVLPEDNFRVAKEVIVDNETRLLHGIAGSR